MHQFKFIQNFILISFISIFFISCGGGGGSSSNVTHNFGVFVDDIVEGIYYKSESSSGYTNERGEFPYISNEKVEFYIGDIKIGEISRLPIDGKVFIHDLLGLDRGNLNDDNLIKIATFLQSLDSDNSTDKIEIKKEDFDKFNNIEEKIENINTDDLLSKKGIPKISKNDVKDHLRRSYANHNQSEFSGDEKNYLYTLFKESYWWSEHVPTSAYSHFRDPNEMINAFKYKSIDKWSYAETFDDYYKSAAQEDSGFGCYFNNTTSIHFIDFDSPCEKVGLKRGDELLKINGIKVTSQSYINTRNNIGVEVTFSIRRNGSNIDIKITPSIYTYKASKKDIITTKNNKKVGYFIYNEFSSKSSDEIEESFTYFKENNVEELVVDLRFNGGGSLAVASILLDKIAGYNNEDKLQFYTYNNTSEKREDTNFMKDENSLNITRVFFLTSKDTASASELVINALKPYMDVKVIGEKTHGKPVGMTGKYISSNYLYWLINFSIYNAKDEGDYFDGINSNCKVHDNKNYSLLNKNEKLLKEALYFIEHNKCYSSYYSDMDGDGIIDSKDNDMDGDGIINNKDSFPLDISASVDLDSDNFPDEWNDGYSEINSTTGLKIDYYPKNYDCNLLKHGDGFECDLSIFIPDFVPDKTAIDKKGVIYLLSNKNERIYRWQDKYLEAIKINKNVNTIFYSSKHDRLYLGYGNGEITYFDLFNFTVEEESFINISNSINNIFRLGDNLLINNGNDQEIYTRYGDLIPTYYTGEISSSAWYENLDLFYFIQNNDLYYYETQYGRIDYMGTNYNPPTDDFVGPMKMSPNSTYLLFGKGDIYNTEYLTWESQVPEEIEKFIWTSDNRFIYGFTEDNKTILKHRRSNLELLEKVIYKGILVDIVKKDNNKFLIITKEDKLIFNEYVPSNDTDYDGVLNNQDAFPLDISASLDNDNDGFPDSWNEGYSETDSKTNLKLDYYPKNFDCNLHEHGNGIECYASIFENSNSIDEIIKDKNGLIYLLSNKDKRIYRWKDKYIEPVKINKDVKKIIYSENHNRIYLAYDNTEINYLELDDTYLKEKFFTKMPNEILSLSNGGNYLLIQTKRSKKYSYEKDGTLASSRYLSFEDEYTSWNKTNNMYYYRYYNNLYAKEVNQETGQVSNERKLSSTRSSNNSKFIKISNNGNYLFLSNGEIYNIKKSIWEDSIINPIEKAIWTDNNEIIYGYTENNNTIIIKTNNNFQFDNKTLYEGALIGIIKLNNFKYIVITKVEELVFNEYTPN